MLIFSTPNPPIASLLDSRVAMAVTRLVAMAMKMPSRPDGAVLERSLPYRRDGVLERSFEADAEVGRVECSGRGCRPVYEDEAALVVAQVTMSSSCGANTRLVHHSMIHAAMQHESHAAFSWKSLSDEAMAKELLLHASTDVLASYANFLWQCDQ